jgi:hypothetical protein
MQEMSNDLFIDRNASGIRRFMRNLVVIIKASQALIVGVVVLGLQNGGSKAQAASLSTPCRDVPSPVGPAITAKSDEALPSRVADLADAPSAQANQTQLSSQASAKQNENTQINPIDLLSPRLISGVPMSMQDKFEIYIHKTYSPAALIFSLFSTGIKMASPNEKYPSAWQDGMGFSDATMVMLSRGVPRRTPLDSLRRCSCMRTLDMSAPRARTLLPEPAMPLHGLFSTRAIPVAACLPSATSQAPLPAVLLEWHICLMGTTMPLMLNNECSYS